MHAEDCMLDEPAAMTAPVATRRLEAGDEAAWDAFVERCPEASFFHRSGWRDILERVFRHRSHYLVAERDGVMVGVLPLAEVKSRLFGHSLVSLPFAVYGGVASNEAAATSALIRAAEALGRSLDVDHLELRHRSPRCPDWPRQDLYVTFRKPIGENVEANMLTIPRKQRAMVRKGIKNGLASTFDAGAGRFFELYADNMHRHGTPPFPRRYFERLLEVFGERCNVLIVTEDSGEPVSGVLSFRHRDEILPYYAGDSVRARDLAANDFKYWELMRRSCAAGARVFDYGRSKRGTGSFDFKVNWGFEPSPLAYEHRLYKGGDIPQHNPLNPKYRAFISLWRHLPRPLVNVIGPSIVRSLG